MKRPLPIEINLDAEDKRSRIQAASRKGVFAEALKGEMFGDHPGQVDLELTFSVYQATRRQEAKLLGLDLELLVSNIEEVDELRDVIEEAIRLWLNGKWDRESGRFMVSYLPQ